MDYLWEVMSERHRQAVIDIFNYYIENSHAAFLDKPVDYGFFDRFLEMCRDYPALVAKTRSGKVVGFGFLRSFHYAESFNRTAEATYFILPEHTGRGLGTFMLEQFTAGARPKGIDSLLASISSRNETSLSFHLRKGFWECGRLKSVGRKFGDDFDVVWMQKRLSE
jgi:L-amino acid N-acyltransferase YncA